MFDDVFDAGRTTCFFSTSESGVSRRIYISPGAVVSSYHEVSCLWGSW